MYLVFDVGGTKTRIATSSDNKTLSEPRIIPTEKDFQKALNSFKSVADELSGGQKIDAVCGGVAGPLDPARTMLVSSPHVGDWVNKPLKSELEKIFNCPVSLENDADLATLGEAIFGSGVNHKIVAYLTISTGVGGGRVIEGKIDQNALGFEPGHQIIVPFGEACACGGKGHLESYVSGSGLQRTHGVKAEEIRDPVVWNQVAKYLAIGLNNVAVFWSPDIIVLGGSVMQSISLEKVKSYLNEVQTIFPNSPEVVLSKNGGSAGLYGALAYINQSKTV